MTKILLLSVSAGAGHVRAAEALRADAETRTPPIAAIHLDVMNFVPAGFRKVYTDFYIDLVDKFPAAWGYLYQMTNDAAPQSFIQRVRRQVERLNTGALMKEIARQAPDAIVCTHFLPAEILANAIRTARVVCPVWVQVTDFDLHRMWVQEHMAGYFAANAEVAYRMRAAGIAPDHVHITGIPIMPAFAAKLNRATCMTELGLAPDRTSILLMGGGAGLGSLDEVATRLLDLSGDFQLIVLAGKNASALTALQSLARRHPGRLVAQGFTNRVERVMACADLVITKPGGLTTSECLAMGLPMIVNAPIPGQEERNADYLLEEGVALKAFDPVTLEYRVGRLLADSVQLAGMRRRAQALARPDAARHALDIVLRNLHDSPNSG